MVELDPEQMLPAGVNRDQNIQTGRTNGYKNAVCMKKKLVFIMCLLILSQYRNLRRRVVCRAAVMIIVMKNHSKLRDIQLSTTRP